MFSGLFDFSRPHIAVKGRFKELSAKEISLGLLKNPARLSYQKFNELSEKLKWPKVTASSTFTEIEDNYYRISKDEYELKELFSPSETFVKYIHEIIIRNMEDGIFPLSNCNEIEVDDDLNYSWNEFIAETIIKLYYTDILIIQPVSKDRRFQKGIAVKKDRNILTYSQIIRDRMLKYNSSCLSESQFLSFLILHGFTRKTIPIELIDSDAIKLIDGNYCAINI